MIAEEEEAERRRRAEVARLRRERRPRERGSTVEQLRPPCSCNSERRRRRRLTLARLAPITALSALITYTAARLCVRVGGDRRPSDSHYHQRIALESGPLQLRSSMMCSICSNHIQPSETLSGKTGISSSRRPHFECQNHFSYVGAFRRKPTLTSPSMRAAVE